MTQAPYLLGVNQAELERLRFQHTVWGPITNRFFDRIGVAEGWKCLDVGAGPGVVTLDLRARVGESGEVTALEPAQYFLDVLAQESRQRGWTNIKLIHATAEEATLPEKYFDLIFARWVVSFVPDLDRFVRRLLEALRPGGVIAFQDYYYEGLSLFPHGGPWDRMADIVRAYFRSGGGDPYAAGKLPALFRQHGLRLVEFMPTCLSGGPTSDVFRWAGQFFTLHTPRMAELGIIPRDEAEALLADWEAHARNPDALFFSPLVVDVAAVLGGQET